MKKMWSIIPVFCMLLFFSCSKGVFYNEEFYEGISGIKIPRHAEIIESFDNGEFVTGTTFHINETDLNEFIKRYAFQLKGNGDVPYYFHGKNYLKLDKPAYSPKDADDLYIQSGSKGKNSWLYIVDLKSNLLWAEIQYPDMGGQ